MGSNKVLRVALGHDAATEYKAGLAELAGRIRGAAGLLFTRLPRAEVQRIFEEFEVMDYARAGARATETFRWAPAGCWDARQARAAPGRAGVRLWECADYGIQRASTFCRPPLSPPAHAPAPRRRCAAWRRGP